MSAKFNFQALGEPLIAAWPVHVNVPQDGGGVQVETFMAKFRLLEPDELDAIAAAERKPKAKPHLLHRAFWVGLADADSPTFTPELVDRMLARSYIAGALFNAYSQFSAGIAEKN